MRSIPTVSKFFRREDGSLSIEAVFALPMLMWVGLVMIVTFDAFRQLNAGQKATYTVADMLSREQIEIDANYMTAALETFEYLTNGNGNNALRITVIRREQDPITGALSYSCQWSQGVGGIAGHPDLDPIEDRLPEMAVGDEMIFVEGQHEWSPGFSVGLTSYRFGDVALSIHRDAQLKFVGDPPCA